MFQRQWFDQKSQIGLTKEAIVFEFALQNHNYAYARKIIKQNISFSPEYWLRQAIRLQHVDKNLGAQKTTVVRYAINNFWPDMNPQSCQLVDLFKSAAPEMSFIYTDQDNLADICFTSCYGYDPLISTKKQPQALQILFLGENVRPSFYAFDLAISFDMNRHLGRNIFLPLWMFEIDLFGKANYKDRITHNVNNFTKTKTVDRGNKLNRIAYIGNNNEPNRISTISWLRENNIAVDCFGQHTNPVENKIELLKNYNATICFENSYFPGYVTEKPIHGYLSDCISIYMGGGDPLLNISKESGFICVEPGLKQDITLIKDIISDTSMLEFAPLFEEELLHQRIYHIKKEIRKHLRQFTNIAL